MASKRLSGRSASSAAGKAPSGKRRAGRRSVPSGMAQADPPPADGNRASTPLPTDDRAGMGFLTPSKAQGELLSSTARHLDYFLAITEVGKALTSNLDLPAVLNVIMKSLSQLMRPANWSLLMVDRERNDLYFEIVVGDAAPAIKDMRLPVGEGIAGWVAQHGKPVVCPNVAEDARFSARMDEASRFVTRSVVCVPLMCRDEVLGVIEMVHDGESHDVYTEEDLQLLLPFADFAAIAIENARSFRKVQELTVRDEWTGLYNARYLEQCLKDEVNRADRYKSPLSVIFIDLDYFKNVNDTRGHSAGSNLLKSLGQLLDATIRLSDKAVRYGGDEFVVILPGTDKAGALELADRLRARLVDEGLEPEPGVRIKISGSFGVASFPVNGTTSASLLEAADRAMYRAKESGRNTVVDASSAPFPSDTVA